MKVYELMKALEMFSAGSDVFFRRFLSQDELVEVNEADDGGPLYEVRLPVREVSKDELGHDVVYIDGWGK